MRPVLSQWLFASRVRHAGCRCRAIRSSTRRTHPAPVPVCRFPRERRRNGRQRSPRRRKTPASARCLPKSPRTQGIRQTANLAAGKTTDRDTRVYRRPCARPRCLSRTSRTQGKRQTAEPAPAEPAPLPVPVCRKACERGENGRQRISPQGGRQTIWDYLASSLCQAAAGRAPPELPARHLGLARAPLRHASRHDRRLDLFHRFAAQKQ